VACQISGILARTQGRAGLERSFFDLLRQFDTTDDHCRGLKALQPQHRAKPLPATGPRCHAPLQKSSRQIMAETAAPLHPALEELMRQAACGEVAHNDDTSMRVLSLDRGADLSPERTGVFTSGIVWVAGERRIALFFTGCKHAGENLPEVLKQRPPGLSPPIQMCDALRGQDLHAGLWKEPD
jgi:hypothetical protein